MQQFEHPSSESFVLLKLTFLLAGLTSQCGLSHCLHIVLQQRKQNKSYNLSLQETELKSCDVTIVFTINHCAENSHCRTNSNTTKITSTGRRQSGSVEDRWIEFAQLDSVQLSRTDQSASSQYGLGSKQN